MRTASRGKWGAVKLLVWVANVHGAEYDRELGLWVKRGRYSEGVDQGRTLMHCNVLWMVKKAQGEACIFETFKTVTLEFRRQSDGVERLNYEWSTDICQLL